MPIIKGFQWDARKNQVNLEKHGIDFDEAVEVFYHRTPFSGQNTTKRSAG
jgi:uncharacterized DUF497 family protein